MKQIKSILIIGVVLGGTGVIAGAFGTHTLGDRIAAEHLNVFETAVRYQMYHALALCITGILAAKNFVKQFRYAALCFFIGVLIFSGSLYALSTSELWSGNYMRWLGAITPIGGLLLIAGWIFLGLAVTKSYK